MTPTKHRVAPHWKRNAGRSVPDVAALLPGYGLACANPDDVYPRSGRLSRRRSDAG